MSEERNTSELSPSVVDDIRDSLVEMGIENARMASDDAVIRKADKIFPGGSKGWAKHLGH